MLRIEDAAGRTTTTTGPRVALLLSALWVVIALYGVHAVLPTNVLGLPFEETLAEPANAVLPQGWAFFTRSPRDPLVTGYEFGADGAAYRIPEVTASDHRNLFGVNRRGRAIGTELALLLDLVPPHQWVECAPAAADCVSSLRRTVLPYRVQSPVPGGRMCGEVALTAESVVPYAYRELVGRRVVVDQAAYLVVECRS